MSALLPGWKSKTALFLSAQTISLLGSSIVQFSIVWYITLNTSSGEMLAISVLCAFLPQVLISLFAGVWADTYSRKLLSIASDAAIALVTLGLAISFMLGFKSIELLFVALIVRSFGTGIQMPAVSAIIPQLVPKEKLLRVNGINTSLTSLMMLASPAIGGFLYSQTSIENIFLVDVTTAIIGISIVAFIPIPKIASDSIPDNKFQAILAGFRYLQENKLIRNLLIFLICVCFLISPAAFLTPLLVNRTFGEEPWRLAVNEMTFSAGAVLGGLLISFWSEYKNKMRITAVACAFFGIFMVALGNAYWFPLYLVLNVFLGVVTPCFNAPITAVFQERIEPEMMGRVFSLVQIALSCSLPLGMVLFGPIADYISIQSLLMISGGLILLTGALFFMFNGEDSRESSRAI
ncbi:MFS transporter [Photorhabdus luminescens]|uniref:MFS transporter n=1 Tax=Photorhabdus akhurstii TaxID=171438 RepID=A0ABX8LZW5_9GAMM|nr:MULTISPECIES: MFS transporter [Photorhabdus]KGM27504.1 MFS transporter [Photorhabdus luminescens]MBS9428402.1 MFS transporter [Photorhabdus akhurstii]MCC8456617.1 MFS transporter [Photorhabdus aegyptia]PQQ32309.1 MFS transporter [Photorhabdus luminescens]PQQ33535.1 MFS transporter [Photorhabdus luminescens]